MCGAQKGKNDVEAKGAEGAEAAGPLKVDRQKMGSLLGMDNGLRNLHRGRG